MEFLDHNASSALPKLMSSVLRHGTNVVSRAGLTKELLHVQITLTNPVEREITTPGRHALLPAQIAETMWLLAGRDDVAWLEHYLPRAPQFSDDGKTWRGAYGPRLRQWDTSVEGDYVGFMDQLWQIHDMLQADTGTRRAVASIYDPRLDLATQSKDIPCNTQLHFIRNHEGALDLRVAIRSNDLMWGWSGINAFAWSALLEIMAELVGMEVGSLVFNQGSLHLYEPSWEKAEKISWSGEITLVENRTPRFHMDVRAAEGYEQFTGLVSKWFELEEKIRTMDSKWGDREVISSIEAFPEPMLRSWLWVIAAWHGAPIHREIKGTALELALAESPGWAKRAALAESPGWAKRAAPATTEEPMSDFATYVAGLHKRKDAAYGDSWKRRGEQVGIQANIARKVDRLGKTDEDETALDTIIDLLVYLIKYRGWLEKDERPEDVKVREALRQLDHQDIRRWANEQREQTLTDQFERLLGYVSAPQKINLVVDMILRANAEARFRWSEVQQKMVQEQLWKEGNATRSWNPEPELADDHPVSFIVNGEQRWMPVSELERLGGVDEALEWLKAHPEAGR